jgi:hypothetical protein
MNTEGAPIVRKRHHKENVEEQLRPTAVTDEADVEVEVVPN